MGEVAAVNHCHCYSHFAPEVDEQGDPGDTQEPPRRPILQPPSLFILAFFDGRNAIASLFGTLEEVKEEIKHTDMETTKAHKVRLDIMLKETSKAEETEHWGVAVKVFSWIGSLIGLITGIALICSGAGAVAGALLIVGSVVQLGSELMEVTGGWKKVKECLPGDDPKKKDAVISWIQVGIAVFSIILGAAGVIFGGFSTVGASTQTATRLFGSIAMTGSAVCTLGRGITGSQHRDYQADAQEHHIEEMRLEFTHKDLMERSEHIIDHMTKVLESFNTVLDLLRDINHNYQEAW